MHDSMENQLSQLDPFGATMAVVIPIYNVKVHVSTIKMDQFYFTRVENEDRSFKIHYSGRISSIDAAQMYAEDYLD